MTNFVDADGKTLEKGLYKFDDSGNLYYFTGEYNKVGAVFEDGREPPRIVSYSTNGCINLNKVSRKCANKKLSELKKRTNWLEDKLKE